MTDKQEPERRVELPGVYNLRDIGGYGTADGRRTRWRTFLRADSLHRLSPESQQALVDMGLRTVIDLRHTYETIAEPNVFSGSSRAEYRHINMVGDDQVYERRQDLEIPERVAFSYSQWIDQRTAAIGEVLRTLAAPGALPAIYHCAGGQDRTGVISALLLGLAGVPEDTIADDYTLTAQYQVDLYFSEHAPKDVVPEDYTVEAYRARNCPAEGMLLTMQHVLDRYGGVEDYVRAAGLDDGQIAGLRLALIE